MTVTLTQLTMLFGQPPLPFMKTSCMDGPKAKMQNATHATHTTSSVSQPPRHAIPIPFTARDCISRARQPIEHAAQGDAE